MNFFFELIEKLLNVITENKNKSLLIAATVIGTGGAAAGGYIAAAGVTAVVGTLGMGGAVLYEKGHRDGKKERLSERDGDIEKGKNSELGILNEQTSSLLKKLKKIKAHNKGISKELLVIKENITQNGEKLTTVTEKQKTIEKNTSEAKSQSNEPSHLLETLIDTIKQNTENSDAIKELLKQLNIPSMINQIIEGLNKTNPSQEIMTLLNNIKTQLDTLNHDELTRLINHVQKTLEGQNNQEMIGIIFNELMNIQATGAADSDKLERLISLIQMTNQNSLKASIQSYRTEKAVRAIGNQLTNTSIPQQDIRVSNESRDEELTKEPEKSYSDMSEEELIDYLIDYLNKKEVNDKQLYGTLSEDIFKVGLTLHSDWHNKLSPKLLSNPMTWAALYDCGKFQLAERLLSSTKPLDDKTRFALKLIELELKAEYLIIENQINQAKNVYADAHELAKAYSDRCRLTTEELVKELTIELDFVDGDDAILCLISNNTLDKFESNATNTAAQEPLPTARDIVLQQIQAGVRLRKINEQTKQANQSEDRLLKALLGAIHQRRESISPENDQESDSESNFDQDTDSESNFTA